MREQSPVHYIGIDIGTSTVRCIVGMSDPDDPSKMSIVGHGSARNIGMRKGVVVHPDDVHEALLAAITEAERVSGVHIHNATVNVNGAHIVGLNSKGVIAISTNNREITPEDRLRVEEAATIVQLPANREIIQVFSKGYRLDGQDNIKDPVGMQGVRLEVDAHIVTASSPNLRALDSVLEKAKIYPSHHTVSALAAAEAVLNRQQKEAGTLLLDIGAGTTNIVVVEDGEIQHVAVLPLGGIHITNDLAIGLKTDLEIAEKVKVNFAGLGENATRRTSISLQHSGASHTFSTTEIQLITEARVDEILDYVDKELKKIHRSRKLPGGVVIVGGTANLPGLAAFTKEKLQLAARIGQLQSMSGLIESVKEPAFTTSIGLMILDMLLVPSTVSLKKRSQNSNFLGSFEGLFKRLRK
ncbi:MAG: cell division protein FtsA [Patescibacteria group bacterium]